MNQLVSIIITTYGGKEAVVDAVESCLNQTYENVEVIVVDDSGLGTARQKNTAQLLEQYITQNKITYIPHQTNRNASVARNTGIKASKGDLIALLDDDDIFCDRKIEEQVKAFDKLSDEYGVVYCTLKDTLEDGNVEIHPADCDGFVLYDFLMMKVSACTSDIMFRRKYYDQIDGFDESFTRHQDWEFLARMAVVCKFHGISYIGTEKHSKYVVKRYSATQAEIFRKHYWKTLDNVTEILSAKERERVFSHEYNEVAKLFFREKNFKKALYYIAKSGRPMDFVMALIAKPFKCIITKIKAACNKPRIIRGW